MNDPVPVSAGGFGDGSPAPATTKAQMLSDAINRLLQNLTIKCAKSEGVRDYYQVGVYGYGASTGPAFSGALAGRELALISEVANNPSRIEERQKRVSDGAGGVVEQTIRFPIWFDPEGSGGTPMHRALQDAHRIVQGFVTQNPDCFPPIVINITDGESTDGDPTPGMEAIKSIASSDGNVLLFNLHLSSNPNAREVTFPNSAADLPDGFACAMFAGASPLTTFMRSIASESGIAAGDGSKGFVLNGRMETIIQALDIGTRPSNLR